MIKKRIWRKVIGFKDRYKVSNYGEVYSIKSKKNLKPTRIYTGALYVHLFKDGNQYSTMMHNLVYKHFKKDELGNKYVHHMDFNKGNNFVKNLDKMKRGDLLRLWYEQKNRARGVYKVNNPASLNKYRAVLKINNKVVTLGYFKKKDDAVKCFIAGYYKQYNRIPFTL